ncbi:MAG: hypothetical protein ACE5HK_08375, partial [Candidatus Methylomirabilales bacterium]
TQVVQAMERMRTMVQQNAQAVTQAAVAAEELHREANAMQQAVSRFVIEDSDAEALPGALKPEV